MKILLMTRNQKNFIQTLIWDIKSQPLLYQKMLFAKLQRGWESSIAVSLQHWQCFCQVNPYVVRYDNIIKSIGLCLLVTLQKSTIADFPFSTKFGTFELNAAPEFNPEYEQG